MAWSPPAQKSWQTYVCSACACAMPCEGHTCGLASHQLPALVRHVLAGTLQDVSRQAHPDPAAPCRPSSCGVGIPAALNPAPVSGRCWLHRCWTCWAGTPAAAALPCLLLLLQSLGAPLQPRRPEPACWARALTPCLCDARAVSLCIQHLRIGHTCLEPTAWCLQRWC